MRALSPATRSDTGPGGTHRRFVEAETALLRAEPELSRTEPELARRVVKTAALLQLGRSAERPKLPRARPVHAVAEGAETPPEAVEAAIEALMAPKLLLHRRRVC